jgi:heme/copper-type cytochrome/quinol oxidase subunit 2
MTRGLSDLDFARKASSHQGISSSGAPVSTPQVQDDNKESKKNIRKLVLLAILIIVIIVVSVFFVELYPGHFSSNSPSALSCKSLVNAKPSTAANATAPANGTATFLIVESDPGSPFEGMNGSAYHALTANWPVMVVHQGQKVVIHLINCASSEDHGFAITHYFGAGLALAPGNSYTLTFTAGEKGTFRVYCSILCAIHPYMQNGELIVE